MHESGDTPGLKMAQSYTSQKRLATADLHLHVNDMN